MQLSILCIITLSGILTSVIGCFIGYMIKNRSNNLISSMFEISAGLMTGIVCFEMIPDSMEISNLWIAVISCIVGIFLTLILDIYISKKSNQTSLLVIISMFIHNVIEGIAVGSAYSYSSSLGTAILISTIVHDLPESIIVGISLNKDKLDIGNRIKQSTFVGLSVGIGAFLGNIIGNISNTYSAICLSLSAGCMLYIVACDLIPTSKNISKNKFISLTFIIGILLAAIITFI